MWHYSNNDNGQGIVYDEQSGDDIAVVYDNTNTSLIAQTPEMFSILEELHDQEVFFNLDRDLRNRINAVLCHKHDETL